MAISLSSITSPVTSSHQRLREARAARLLLPLSQKNREQAMLFQYFNDTYEAVVQAQKRGGTFDDGIVALRAESITVVGSPPENPC